MEVGPPPDVLGKNLEAPSFLRPQVRLRILHRTERLLYPEVRPQGSSLPQCWQNLASIAIDLPHSGHILTGWGDGAGRATWGGA